MYLEVDRGLQMEREAKKICHRRDKIVEILTAQDDLLFSPKTKKIRNRKGIGPLCHDHHHHPCHYRLHLSWC